MSLSATNRLPSEIWGEILDSIIDIPFFFDLGCTLDDFYDWAAKQMEISKGAPKLYAFSERQRRVLCLVCRSWKSFADSRADRWVSSRWMNGRWVNGRWVNDPPLPARSLRVYIDDDIPADYTQETKWKIFGLCCRWHPTTGEYGAPILRLAQNHEKHSNLRRISLASQSPLYSADSNPLLNSLAAFSNLRTLDFYTHIFEAPQRPILLPRLTNLRWFCQSNGRCPHECFHLPSLRYLRVPIARFTHESAVLVAPYRCTLKHLILGYVGYEGVTETAVYPWTLPPWENYPNLVELAIDTPRALVPSVPCPPPLGHPLKTFRIPTWDSKSIMAMLGHEEHRNHLERIIVTRLRWCKSVVLPIDHVGAVEDHHVENDLASVIQLCSERGVRLEDGLHQTVRESNRRYTLRELLSPGHTTSTYTGKGYKREWWSKRKRHVG